MKIAVVGSGISGLGAAWLLAKNHHDVSIFESAPYFGGHSNTLDVSLSGQTFPVDTGFIVYNEKNYTLLSRLFAYLGVPTHASDMSFSFANKDEGFEYAGSTQGLLLSPKAFFSRKHWRLTFDILSFYRRSPHYLATLGHELVLKDFLAREGYSSDFIRDHLVPMCAAIWSCESEEVENFSALSMLQFCDNHGLLQVNNRPQWRSIIGGSRVYVEKLLADLAGKTYANTPVMKISQNQTRQNAKTTLYSKGGEIGTFDHVILATHADQTLQILGAMATPLQRHILGAFRYTRNEAILHDDVCFLPSARRLWSSWNVLRRSKEDMSAQCHMVTYLMNKLQKLPVENPLMVTLNPAYIPEEKNLLARLSYDHPILDHRTHKAQGDLHLLQNEHGLWFCGAYAGFCFHEDGLASGFAVAQSLGAKTPWKENVVSTSPAVATTLNIHKVHTKTPTKDHILAIE